MISRYDIPEMSQLWTEEAKFHTFLQVELALLKALEHFNRIPVGTHAAFSKVKINKERIYELERTTKHDVLAFCSSITEQVSPEFSRYFHYGVTSSDIIDTALSLQIKRSMELILPQLAKTLSQIKEKAIEHQETLAMGRSHGMNAEPMSFGQKFLGIYGELARRYQDLFNFYQNELTAQFSGAVGNYTILTPEIEEYAATLLGLQVEPLSTQVIPRDRLAKLIGYHALLASGIERFAVEIRHLHHSDIGEIHEGFTKGQKGSSTMPHKKNPISGENLSGLVRVLRSHQSIALENIVLWHERDISHSSAERMYLPDNFGLTLYTLKRLGNTIQDLVVHKEIIENKAYAYPQALSSFYLHHLIDHTSLTREELYPIVQHASFSADKNLGAKGLAEEIQTQLGKIDLMVELPTPTDNEIKSIFLKQIGKVFNRSLDQYNIEPL